MYTNCSHASASTLCRILCECVLLYRRVHTHVECISKLETHERLKERDGIIYYIFVGFLSVLVRLFECINCLRVFFNKNHTQQEHTVRYAPIIIIKSSP